MSNDLDSWLAGFHELNPAEIEEDTKSTKEEHKLDLFKTVLPALDRRDIHFYNSLTDEQKKDIGIWVLTRWMSSTMNNPIDQMYTVNEVVNKNSKIFSSKKSDNALESNRHKELQWMLLAISGSGRTERHVWPGAPKGVKKNALEDAILAIYPLINDNELELILRINTQQELTNFFKENGYDDKSIKELFKSS
ncbi:MAG TPA: hypothetical protein VIY47_15090 [Ignavibacteriaceae bacterium]